MTQEFFLNKLFKMTAIGHMVVQPHVGFDGKQRRYGLTKEKWLENTWCWGGGGEKRVNKDDENPKRCSSKWRPLDPRETHGTGVRGISFEKKRVTKQRGGH
jgi:hypothetical protein